MPGTEGRRALRLGHSANGPAAFLASPVTQGAFTEPKLPN